MDWESHPQLASIKRIREVSHTANWGVLLVFLLRMTNSWDMLGLFFGVMHFGKLSDSIFGGHPTQKNKDIARKSE